MQNVRAEHTDNIENVLCRVVLRGTRISAVTLEVVKHQCRIGTEVSKVYCLPTLLQEKETIEHLE